MVGRGRVLLLIGLVAVSAGCNARDPAFDTPTAPVGPSGLPSGPGVLGVSLRPAGLNGSGTSIGTVALTSPAPPGGATIDLSAGDPAVSVPASVTVPEGSWNIQFTVSTQVVAADTQVPIVASLGGRSASAVLGVWATLPTSFSWNSDVGDPIGLGGFGRFTPPRTVFQATCEMSELAIHLRTGLDTVDLLFAAPPGTPLRVGTYEGASSSFSRTGTVPGLRVPGGGGCGTKFGRFVVHEAEFNAQGEAMRFWATFEQRCSQATTGPALRGEVRLTNVPFFTFTAGCTR